MAVLGQRNYRIDNPIEFNLKPLSDSSETTDQRVSMVLFAAVAILLVYLGMAQRLQPRSSHWPISQSLPGQRAFDVPRRDRSNGASAGLPYMHQIESVSSPLE